MDREDTRVMMGRIDESERALGPGERPIAEALAAEGRTVSAIGEGRAGRADALVDGERTGFETLGPGSTGAALAIALSRAARHAVLDARGSGLCEQGARHGVGLFLGTLQGGRLRALRVFGDRFEVSISLPGEVSRPPAR